MSEEKGGRSKRARRTRVERAERAARKTYEIFVPNTPIKITQLYGDEEVEQIVKERDEYKRRAEFAKSALHKACEQLNFCVDPPKYTYSSDSETEERDDYCEYDRDNDRDNDCVSCRENYFLRQAEKELAEEGKDD